MSHTQHYICAFTPTHIHSGLSELLPADPLRPGPPVQPPLPVPSAWGPGPGRPHGPETAAGAWPEERGSRYVCIRVENVGVNIKSSIIIISVIYVLPCTEELSKARHFLFIYQGWLFPAKCLWSWFNFLNQLNFNILSVKHLFNFIWSEHLFKTDQRIK